MSASNIFLLFFLRENCLTDEYKLCSSMKIPEKINISLLIICLTN